MNDLTAEYDFTYRLFVEANRLHRAKSLRVSLFFWLLFVGVPVITVAIGLLVFVASRQGDESGSLLSIFWVFAFYSAFMWGLRSFSFRKTYKNSFPKNLTSRLVSLTISERRVHAITSGEVETNITWASLCRVVHNETLALMYYSKTRFIPVPKQSLAANEWESFLTLSEQKLGTSRC